MIGEIFNGILNDYSIFFNFHFPEKEIFFILYLTLFLINLS